MVSEKTTDAALPEGQGAGARPILADQTARRV